VRTSQLAFRVRKYRYTNLVVFRVTVRDTVIYLRTAARPAVRIIPLQPNLRKGHDLNRVE
jgi:hypothetical protein